MKAVKHATLRNDLLGLDADCQPSLVEDDFNADYPKDNGGAFQQMSDPPFTQNDLLAMWNNTAYLHQREKCVHELFYDQVALTPDAIAVEANGKTLTYQQLNTRSNRLARFLQKRGVQPNTFVGIALERSIEAIVGIYAVLKAGGAYVPLDPVYPKDRLAYMAQTANISVLLTRDKLTPLFVDLLSLDLICIDSDWPVISTENCSNLKAVAKPDDLIYLIFTSGSTGRPKGAAVYHRGFLNLINWFVTEYSIDDSDCILLLSSLSFDLTQKNLYATLITGGRLCLLPTGPYNPEKISNIIQSQGITLINCTPSAFYSIVESLPDNSLDILKSLRIVFLGGEPISIPRLKPWLTHPQCHAQIANTYGPTECTDICAAYRMTRNNMDQYEFVPIGRPIHNVQLVIVDTDFNICKLGESGELCVAGTGIGAGYINDKETTKAKFLSNPFPEINGSTIYRTGDQARWLPDGQIEFLGRLDHQIKIRGFRVELHEIESLLKSHPKVREAIVIVNGSAGDENSYLVCHVMSHQKTAVKLDEIKDYLKRQLPDYMIPSLFHFRDSMPLSPNGKVDRIALQNEKETNRPAFESNLASAPVSRLERRIMTIWSEILGHCHLTIDDSFFEIGGNSLAVTALTQHLRLKLNKPITTRHIYENSNIRELAKVVSQLNDIQEDTSNNVFAVDSKTGNVPILNAQLISWFNRCFIKHHASHVCEIFVLDGNFDSAQFQLALDHVVERHATIWCPFDLKNPLIKIGEPKKIKIELIDISKHTEQEQVELFEASVQRILHSPIDLNQSPLGRMGVIKQHQSKHFLLVSFPHIIADSQSLNLFVHEVLNTFRLLKVNDAKFELQRKTTLLEMVTGERKYMQSEEFEQDYDFWKTKLEESEFLKLERKYFLPYGKPGTRKLTSKIKLNPKALVKLEYLAQQSNTSVQMAVLALIKATLHKISGQDDISVTMICDARGLYAHPPVMNLNASSIVIRSQFSSTTTYTKLLTDVKWFVIDALNHLKFPGSIILTIPVLSRLRQKPLAYFATRILGHMSRLYFYKGKINRHVLSSLACFWIWSKAVQLWDWMKKSGVKVAPPVVYNVLPNFYQDRLLWSDDQLTVTDLRKRKITMNPDVFKENSKYNDARVLNFDLIRDENNEALLLIWGGGLNDRALTLIHDTFLEHLENMLDNPNTSVCKGRLKKVRKEGKSLICLIR